MAMAQAGGLCSGSRMPPPHLQHQHRRPFAPPRGCSSSRGMPKSLPHHPVAASSSSSSGEAAPCSPSSPSGVGQSRPMQQAGARHQLAATAPVVAALAQAFSKLHAWMQRHRIQQLLLGTGQRPGALSSDAGCLAAAAALSFISVPPLPGGGVADLFINRVFLAGFWAWFSAQFLKIFTKRARKGVWDVRAIVDSGGMPSSHSAMCAGITTAIVFQHGFGSAAFALALGISSIVMYDAAGVRRHAGRQAEVLNQVVGELLDIDHPVQSVKLKEVLGHTPLQVAAGALLGILFGIFYPA